MKLLNSHNRISRGTRLANTALSLLLLVSASAPASLAAAKKAQPGSAAKATKPATKAGTTTPAQAVVQNEFKEAAGIIPADTWRKSPPTVPAPRPFSLPSINSYKLDNGLLVQLVEDHRFPFLTVALGTKVGSTQEPDDKLGLADMTADMLTEGTEHKSSKQVADEVDFIGGALKSISDYDFSIVSGSSLSKYTDRLFNIFDDVIFHPSFPEDELKLKKTNMIQELAMKRSEPDFLAEERFNKVVFGNHPYGVVAPTPATIENIKRQDLIDFHTRTFVPNESVLVVVGDFDSGKMKGLIADKFSQWKQGTIASAELPLLPKLSGRHIYLVDRPGSVQSSVKIGNVSIKRTDPDYFPMLVTNQILGGAASARLFLNIREQKGFTYGAYSAIAARRQPGTFMAEAEVRSEVTGPSLQEFLYELDRIRTTKVADKELKDAKSYLTGSFQLGLETQSGLAQRLLESKLFDLPNDYLETFASKVMAVNVDDVRKVARRLIDTNNLVITVVGDSSKVKPELEMFGFPIDVYDTSGKLSTEADKTARPGS